MARTPLPFLALLLLSALLPAQAAYAYYAQAKEGSSHRVFENRVNLRKEPSTRAEILCQATLGDELSVLSESGNGLDEINGFQARWYEVECKGAKGYLWGGLFSTTEFEEDFDVPPAQNIPGFALLDDQGFKPKVAILEARQGFGDGDFASVSHAYYAVVGGSFKFVFTYTETSGPGDGEAWQVKWPKTGAPANTIAYEKTNAVRDGGTGAVVDRAAEERRAFRWNGAAFIELPAK